MSINNDLEKLKIEEQKVLDDIVDKIDKEIGRIDKDKNEIINDNGVDISVNPDEYTAKIIARKKLKGASKELNDLYDSRDELYNTRILHMVDDINGSEVEEIKIGIHSSVTSKGEYLIYSWTNPVCRHYILDSTATDYEYTHKDKYGDAYITKYRLLIKNKIKLRFSIVENALNMFSETVNDEFIE